MLFFALKSLLMLWFAWSYLYFLDNGVMTIPERRIVSFAFTVLCFKSKINYRQEVMLEVSS